MSDTYYFYTGFQKPKEITFSETTFSHNYRGDVTEEVIEAHEEWKHESDRDYNDTMSEYGVYRNPTLKELQSANQYYGLDGDTYLEDFLSA
ncbi:hypothetical protein IMZ31_23595 (plasmid) [Pontibacillus sp. ALD_SL1]|uniref:hypothetical protein n=1 Tax=Pontibacillus sp. ALD_SL1 TaxID=2777185 RepID=UPI001A96225F|nr:hypothetical protein [Pontibacillus sp. ALD_SL1]QST02436.1 hypothetical protein IMZ31_23595 [Pontibacillus sp. ALD_SL1]